MPLANPPRSMFPTMNTRAFLTILLAATALAPAADTLRSADARLATGLTLDDARRAASAAERFAREQGASPAIAVVDAAGDLVFLLRLDGGFPAAARIAAGKARTAARFRKSTKDFEDLVNQGRYTMTALEDFTPLQGGIPILLNGQVVGAVGVSGAKSAGQDEEVARAATAALARETSQPGS